VSIDRILCAIVALLLAGKWEAHTIFQVNSGTATSSALHVQGEWELTTIGNWQGTLNLQGSKIDHTGWEAIRAWSDANATNWPSFDDVALYAAAAPTPTPTRTPTRQPTPEIGSNLDLTGFSLVFADNFNTLSVRSPEDKGSAKWLGHGPYGAASNFSKSQWSWDRRTLRVENGALVNTAWWDESINNWRSGLISSMDRQGDGFAQRFGYWEARMRMPDAGRGAFPAFWLLATTTIPNHTGIKGYEIDILEWFGKDAPQSADRFAHTIHEWNPDGSSGAGSEGKWVDAADPINTWHTYGCMVTPWWIAFYLDGVCTWTKPTNPDYDNSPLYVMINYSLGGGWPVTGEPYASRGDSALLVDYVYAYAPPAAWQTPQAPSRLKISFRPSQIQSFRKSRFNRLHVLQARHTARW
jgi:beta-glucanase (GH16 family)